MEKRLERLPLNATFELTARCNLCCKMCLIRVDHQRMRELGGRERTTEEWTRMGEELKDAGTIGLLLTGGEPLLRPDFNKIYQALAPMGFMLTLYTNATLLTEETMRVLANNPPHRIGVTVYGASPRSYKKVTGNEAAYDAAVAGIRRLKQLPSKLTIRTTLIKENVEELDEITELAASVGEGAEFNVSRIVTMPVRGGIAEVAACRLTPEQNVRMLEKRNRDTIMEPFLQYMEAHPELSVIPNKPEREMYKKDNKSTLYGCEAGMSSFTITWDGRLVGCQMLGDCSTYPFDQGFLEAWEEYPNKVKLPPIPEPCRHCDVGCCACPATRLAETGSLGGLPEYLCEEGKIAKEMEARLITEIKMRINIGRNNCGSL